MQVLAGNLRFNATFYFIRQKISPVEKLTFSTEVYECGKC